jgi:hypothetical protein
MTWRKWLYASVGLGAAGIVALTWFEQSTGLLLADGSQALVNSNYTTILALAAFVICPVALFDYFWWLMHSDLSLQSKWLGVGTVLLGFIAGWVLRWNGSICLKEGGVPNHPQPDAGYDEVYSCFGTGDPTFSIAVGLVFASVVALVFWLAGRRPINLDSVT